MRLERQSHGNAGGAIQLTGERVSRTDGHRADGARHAGAGRSEPAAPGRAGTLAVAQDGGPRSGVHRRLRHGSRRRAGPAAAPSTPEFAAEAEENGRKPSGDGATDETENGSAHPCSAVSGSGGPHGSFAEHDLPVAGRCGNHCDQALLRTYWYDAAPDAVPTSDQLQIGAQQGVKLRLGRLSKHGQKGVDSRIVRDLIVLSRNRAVSSVYRTTPPDSFRRRR